jgi:outer membrane protein
MKTLFKPLLVVGLFSLACGVQAQMLKGWRVIAGATNIKPNVTSEDLSAPSLPGTKVNIEDATQFSGGFAYDINDNWGVLFAVVSLPFEHDLVGDGAISGAGKIGLVKQLPPTILGQYKFLDAASPFRPYVGAGATYAYFFDEEGTATLTALTNPGGAPTTLSAKSKLASTVQIGGQFAINKNWFVDVNAMKTFLKTTTSLSTGQRIDTKLDPLAINVWAGYRF